MTKAEIINVIKDTIIEENPDFDREHIDLDLDLKEFSDRHGSGREHMFFEVLIQQIRERLDLYGTGLEFMHLRTVGDLADKLYALKNP